MTISGSQGLSTSEAAARFVRYGPNEVVTKKKMRPIAADGS